MKRVLALMLVLVAPFVGTAAAFSQDWPTRPVKVLVGFPAGTSTDIIARLYAERLAEHFKQPFVVENVPGAAGNRAAAAAAAADGDGYTLLMGTVANAISQAVYKRLKHDITTDFAPITTVGSAPTVLVVNARMGIATVQELVAFAKANPEKTFFGSAGVGTAPHLAGELFNQLAGVKMIHVPYKGTSEAITDLISGSISVVFCPLPTAAELIKAGQIKALAMGSSKRSLLMPELPTLAESGLSGFDAVVWYGFLAPKGTPQSVVEAIAKAANGITVTADMKAKLAVHGAEPLPSSPGEFEVFVRDDVARWRRIVQAAGVQVE
jgi:tripartite-type tricarboxylate transporter receptor subunit TctC